MRKKLGIYLIVLLVTAMCGTGRASAFSFNLDSIAAMGKFPRFVVNTYRWGDKFFNGYDTAYVVGTGYKFSAKLTTDSWTDGYRFNLPENKKLFMLTDPSTSIGAYLSYLAVSVGYDINISKLTGGPDRERQRWRFGFNCMLFAAEAYMSSNTTGTTIKEIGDRSRPIKPDLAFHGIDNQTWGLDLYYFFNHKRYSEAASFNFSRVQRRSQGAFYTGISIYAQNLNFDFSGLPKHYLDELPQDWAPEYHYRVDTKNYAIRFGYGYNWVFHPGWLLGVSESPIIGVRKGFVTPWDDRTDKKISLSLYNRLRLSIVWNSKRWFFGAVSKFDLAIINNKKTTYAGGVLNAEAVVGFRFNIW